MENRWNLHPGPAIRCCRIVINRGSFAMGHVEREADRLLTKRRYFLATEQRRLERVFESQRDALDRGARLLFERIIHGIAAEIHWLDAVLSEAQP